MSLRIHTNALSLATQTFARKSSRAVEENLRQMASGSRLSSPATAPGDLAVAENLNAQMKGFQASRSNIQSVTSFAQIAEGALNEQSNILIRLRELAMQASSSDSDNKSRSLSDLEFQQLSQELDRIAKTTSYGSHKLLAGSSSSYEFQVGPYDSDNDRIKIKIGANTTSSELDIKGSSVDSASSARRALSTVDKALEKVNSARAQFGALQSRVNSAINHSESMVENLAVARSNIADADLAQATSEFYRNRALQQYQLAAMSEANQLPLASLKLIG